jgi:hypothetical protein
MLAPEHFDRSAGATVAITAPPRPAPCLRPTRRVPKAPAGAAAARASARGVVSGSPRGFAPPAGNTNAALQGAFVDIGRGFLRVIGLLKTTMLLGFTIAAYNTDRVRAFRRKHRIETAEEPAVEVPAVVVRRAKRRAGTWRDLLGDHSPPG